MKSKLHLITRILLVLLAAALITILYVPLWRIELSAPQYPEGLKLLINTNGLGGNVDIVNGLNHYIGMKTLHNEDFIEFTVLPFCIIFFAIACMIVALVNRRRLLNVLLFSFLLFGIIAMIDFWRWEYDYGHNLDPNAAIIVPGMAYQPPLIGFKQLLNFGAYSIPDKGGWLFIGVGVLILSCVIFEWKRGKRNSHAVANKLAFAALFILFFLQSCNTSPDPIKIGSDNCYSCKMTISDQRFGAVLITRKGKQLKFDDIHCMLSTVNSNGIDKKDIASVYFVDFSGQHALSKSTSSHLLRSQTTKAPMNGDVISFSNTDSFRKAIEDMKGKEISFEDLIK